MDKKKILAISITLGVVALVLLGWGLARRKPRVAEALRFGYLPIAADASFFVAVERGFFAEQGLKVEPLKFETSNQILEALVAGRIDGAAPVALEAALALEANTPGNFQLWR